MQLPSFNPPNPALPLCIIGKFYSNVGRMTWCIFDPPYKNCNVKAYRESDIDHREMVDILLRAKFRWVLSEYEDKGDHGLYRVLGEPIRIRRRKCMENANHRWTREYVTECLWSNFEVAPVLQSVISEGIKRMPKIDTAVLLQDLIKQRDDADAAIRAVQRTIQRNLEPAAASRRSKAHPAKASGNNFQRKGHKWSSAQKAAMSAKLKASWAARKKGKK
jgi:hypothetical protein